MVRTVALALLALLVGAGCGPLVLEADPLMATLDGGTIDGGVVADGGVVDAGVERDGGPSHAADVNSDGCVDTTDLDLVQALWGETGGPGDANDDGTVDVQDLNMVLAAWGTGCPDAGVADSGNDTGNRR